MECFLMSIRPSAIRLTPTGKPPPLAVRLAKALPFRRAQIEMKTRSQRTTTCIRPMAPMPVLVSALTSII